MAGSIDGVVVLKDLQPLRSDFEKALSSLLEINGTELAQAGRLGQRRLQWVQDLLAKAQNAKRLIVERFAPSKKKSYDAWKAVCANENEWLAPMEAIIDRARPVISAFQLELNRQAEVEAARLRELQRKAEEEQRRAQEAEAARLREEAAKLAAQDAAAAEEKLAEAEFVQAQPVVPIAITAEQIAPQKIDSGRVVYFRKLENPQLFLNWVLKEMGDKLRLLPRADDDNESVIEGFGWTLTLTFATAWKSKDAGADIPGVKVIQGYETRTPRSRR